MDVVLLNYKGGSGSMKDTPARFKNISEYKHEQLPLPFFVSKDAKETESRTIELYDSIPKYLWGTDGHNASVLTREFECRGIKYEVSIFPARIKKDSQVKFIYPGLKEELVEDALRKMACDKKNGSFFDGEAGVVFTLYQLKKELKNHGHTYSINQLKEALLILQGTTINLKTNDGNSILQSQLFEAIGLQTINEWKDKKTRTNCYVKFNSLVTQSIKSLTFRPINIKQCMEYDRTIARWLHKRISHNYTQAGVLHPYSIKLTTIIRDSGMRARTVRYAYNKVIEALEEMKVKGIIDDYSVTDEIIEKRKLVDVKFTLKPSLNFISEMKKFNKQIKEARNM